MEKFKLLLKSYYLLEVGLMILIGVAVYKERWGMFLILGVFFGLVISEHMLCTGKLINYCKNLKFWLWDYWRMDNYGI